MLDPREQKKGGFGAFVAREQERHDVRAAAETQGSPASPGDALAPSVRSTSGGTPDAPTTPAGEAVAPAADGTTAR